MRVVHCKKEPYDVYIGRPSAWGNPFSHKDGTRAEYKVSTREQAIETFEVYIRTQFALDPFFILEYLKPIAGKTLGCWCAPKPCHGDVLIKLCRELGLTT